MLLSVPGADSAVEGVGQLREVVTVEQRDIRCDARGGVSVFELYAYDLVGRLLVSSDATVGPAMPRIMRLRR